MIDWCIVIKPSVPCSGRKRISEKMSAGFIKFHQLIQKLLVMGGGRGGGGHSNSTFYSVKLCVMINCSLQHNVLWLSFVVVLNSMYSLYAVIKMVLPDERSCHV